jgi:PPOX class probable F420-dependent enzyme
MGVGFDDDELWRFLEDSHTGILTTLRADGWPVALPVWFTTHDNRIYVQTPARTRKVAHVRRDPRVCFTAEAGVAWAELRAVVLTGQAEVVPDGEERDLAMGRISEKYGGFGIPETEVPAVTVRHYDTPAAVIRIEPDSRPMSWDNRKLRLRSDSLGG